jgi:hypothetical protein
VDGDFKVFSRLDGSDCSTTDVGGEEVVLYLGGTNQGERWYL